jgi:hypothetical protein
MSLVHALNLMDTNSVRVLERERESKEEWKAIWGGGGGGAMGGVGETSFEKD